MWHRNPSASLVSVLTAALSTMLKAQKHPRYRLMKKTWFIQHTRDCCCTVEKKIPLFATPWMGLEGVILGKRVMEERIIYNHT